VTPDTGGAGDDPVVDDADMGEPVVELRELSLAVNEQFGRRVRTRIERRRLAGECVQLAWVAPFAVFLEFLRWPFELFNGKPRT